METKRIRSLLCGRLVRLLLDVHTVNERVEISTVKKLNDFLLETLQRIE